MVNLNINGLKSRLHFLFAQHIFSMFFLKKNFFGGGTTQKCLNKLTLTVFITKRKKKNKKHININSRLWPLWHGHGIIWIIQWHHAKGDFYFLSTWNNISWDSTEPTDLSAKSLQHSPFKKKVPTRAGLKASRLYCMA